MLASLVLARRHQCDEPAEEFYRRRGSAGSELVFENPRQLEELRRRQQRWPRVPALLDLRGERSADRRPAIAELITRIHFGLVSVNFEMNWEGPAQPDRGPHLAALLMVIRNEADPVTAREECEEP